MQIWYTVESFLLYCCISVLIIGVYNNKTKPINGILLLSYVPLFYWMLQMDFHLFMLIYPVQALLNVIWLKISYPKVKITSILFIYILLFSFNAIFTSVAVVLIPVNQYLLEFAVYFLTLIGCCLLSFSGIKTTIKQTMDCMPKLFKTLLLLLLVLLAIINTLMNGIFDEAKNGNWIRMVKIFTMLTVIAVFLLLPIVINHAVQNQQLQQLTNHYQQQIEAQAKHYSAIAKNNWELRRFQHDSKNLKVGLSELLESGDSREALKMLNDYYEMSQGSKESILKFDTGNGIADALLADKQQMAQDINTTISFDGTVPSAGIAPTDLCVLFGNTLDNAIDACKQFPVDTPKNIHIVCKCVGSYLMVLISNPVVENVVIHKNTIPTTKEDKSVHGFGLYSLKQVVKKHDGALTLSCQNNVFEIAIDLCIDQ